MPPPQPLCVRASVGYLGVGVCSASEHIAGGARACAVKPSMSGVASFLLGSFVHFWVASLSLISLAIPCNC